MFHRRDLTADLISSDVARVDDPWTLNQSFLDGRIAAGDKMILSLPKQDIRPGSYLEREVQHLQSNDYQWVNQWALRPME
ncbi:hypothetical protein ATY41_02090 [Leifsonia xyli subsp. xyli]|uniref:Uncharacterized protein n=1 Tax=Leifsonia xyli subsp. xyli TaxID=59736 RepID=A0A1E2SL44_LEIXY|nr:hypothetical protein [Leifsonia xyli]ODA90441.1 hypothetical protein ATY41_02090 [Leifsonia xyli subsp. xyli]